MAKLKMYDFTRDFYKVPVELKVAGAVVDPTGNRAEFAIIPETGAPGSSHPVDADWKDGDWETDATTSPTTYLARALVGDSLADHVITKGTTYDVYFRMTDSPERPARFVGQIVAL